MEEIVAALLDANTRLTDQLVGLATAIIENGTNVAIAEPPIAHPIPAFDEYAKLQELTDTERLFYTEEEEDERWLAEMDGPMPETSTRIVQDILKAAGMEPTVETN